MGCNSCNSNSCCETPASAVLLEILTTVENILNTLTTDLLESATPYHLVGAASNNATVLKDSAGTLIGFQGFNVNASPRFVKFYDTDTTPDPSTDVPKLVFMIPGNTAGAGCSIPIPGNGAEFTNGISFALVTGISDTDNTAIGADEVVIDIEYK